MISIRNTIFVGLAVVLAGCSGDDDDDRSRESQELVDTIEASASGEGLDAYALPASDDLENIPQDPNNPLTAEKVVLGQMLYHETALATNGNNDGLAGTWSCASCHHAAAGFKAGIPQGIGEGGVGFGVNGEGRILGEGFDAASDDMTLVPDVQPVTSPSILNTAFQEVMLWNGQFGNVQGGVVNAGLATSVLATPDTPKAENNRGLAGLEIQAIAGTGVHRLKTDEDTILQNNAEYAAMFEAAFPASAADVLEDAGKAIAAYERTVLSNEAAFQLWLKGDDDAMSDAEIRGATLFFGDAGCVDCHRGPGLSSEEGASEAEMFFAIGFADFDPNNAEVTGTVDDATSRGRGGFTGEEQDNYKFKVPQLYNLTDTDIFGHGASFSSVRDVVAYKNAGVSQKVLPDGTLDSRFVPLGLTEEEVDEITLFIESALYDPNLERYVPESVPSGNCFPVADDIAEIDLGC